MKRLAILILCLCLLGADYSPFGSGVSYSPFGEDKASEVVRSPRVLFFTDGSAACKKVTRSFVPLRNAGWSIGKGATNHVQVVNVSEQPNLWTRYGSEKDGLPLLVAVEDNLPIRSLRAGCATPLDQWGIGWLLKGVDERPTPKREPVTVENGGLYPVRGSWWSVSGYWNASKDYTINHLLSGPLHSRLRPYASAIRRFSRAEAHSLHSDDHENRVQWAYLRSPKKPVKRQISRALCPT